MDLHALTVLQFERILEILRSYSNSPGTRELIGTIRPVPHGADLISWHKLIAETLELLASDKPPPRVYIPDMNDIFVALRHEGRLLTPDALLFVAQLLRTSRETKRYLEKLPDEVYPRWREFRTHLISEQPLEQRIEDTFDDHGEVKDSASPKLERIRREILKQQDRIRGLMSSTVSSLSVSGLLREDSATIRNGRLVIAVRSDQRLKVRGIIHDQSASGATVFLEPEDAIPLNNELARLQAEERHEVRRILTELTEIVRNRSAEIRAAAHAMHEIDLALAKGRMAIEFGGRPAEFGAAGHLILRQARHPILVAQAIKEQMEQRLPRPVIPMDLELSPRLPMLVVSGPNAGGKTVVLKTVGLLAMMAQAGLPVTVGPGTIFPIFDVIYADIGDEQSIEASLSTFSAHIKNIVKILEGASHRDLVLLDELGAGTDPNHGSALGVVFLKRLLDRKCLTICSSHQEGIKEFAQIDERILPGSVEFDELRLCPTYILNLGRIGQSHAFHMARMLGIPSDIIAESHDWLDQRELEKDRLLSLLEAQELDLRRRLEDLENREKIVESTEMEMAHKLSEAERKAELLISEAEQTGLGLVKDLQQQFEAAVRLAAEGKINDEERRDIRRRLSQQREQLVNRLSECSSAPQIVIEFQRGDRVYIPRLRSEGIVINLDPFTVNVAGKRIQLNSSEIGGLRRASSAEKSLDVESVKVELDPSASAPEVSSRLYLLGMNIEDALQEADKYLERAMRADFPFVTLVHGVGTGALRNGVRAFLRTHKLVAGVREGVQSEGGPGVTIVHLRR